MPTELLDAVGGNMETVRFLLALAGLSVLLYWTLERFMGEREDPTLRYTSQSDTGFMGIIMSGKWAVIAVASVVAVFLLPEVMAFNPLVWGILLTLVVAHWIVEKEERE